MDGWKINAIRKKTMTVNQRKILDLLTASKKPLTIQEMADSTGLQVKKVSMVTRDLAFEGAIVMSKSSRLQTYTISQVKADIFPSWFLPAMHEIKAGIARTVTFETEEDLLT